MKISEGFLAELIKVGNRTRFSPGDKILREGDPPEGVILLLEGRVKVTMAREDGKSYLLGIVEHIETLGATGVLSATNRSCTVTAMTSCRGHRIMADHFLAVVKNAEFGCEMQQQAFCRVAESNIWHATTSACTADIKLCRALLRFARPRPDGLHSVEHITHEEIASSVGLSRQMIDRELRFLRDAGVIRTAQKSVVILEMGRLILLAEQGRRRAHS